MVKIGVMVKIAARARAKVSLVLVSALACACAGEPGAEGLVGAPERDPITGAPVGNATNGAAAGQGAPLDGGTVTLPDGAVVGQPQGDAAGGGGGGGGGGVDASAPPVTTCPGAPATPTFTLGAAYYFSDCAVGAAAGCVAGDNANAGTSAAAPKRDLTGFNVNTLPAGTQLRFARGGAWTNFRMVLQNYNATATSPIVVEAYSPSWGGTAKPWLKASAGISGFEFGTYQQDVNDDGGYVVRDLKIDGQGAADWGFWLRAVLRNVLIENMEITGFKIGLHVQSAEGTAGIRFLTVRNNNIHHNSDMGWLGNANDLRIEGNTIANNNYSGSGFSHGIYLGGGGVRAVVRNNVLTGNSVVGGTCTGGNLTVHGRWDGVTIEGNTISQTSAAGGCYGVSLNPGYATAEYLRNFVVRGNTIVNLGYCAICASSAPGIVMESNVIGNTQATYQAGLLIGGDIGAGDDADTAGVVRNNTVYFAQAGAGSEGVALRGTAGQNLRVASNLIYFGAGSNASHHCFAHPALSNFTTFANNLCHHAGGGGDWSTSFATLAAAQGAGFDVGGTSAAPNFVAAPASGNGYSCQLQAASPAVNAGHPTASSPVDRACGPRSVPDIGACER